MKIKAAVVDFAKTRETNFLIKGIEHFCEIVDDVKAPEYVLYSCFGSSHLIYSNAVKIFICDENVYPDFNQCDYAIGSLRLNCGGRYLWFPPCFSTYLNRDLPNLPKLDYTMAQRKFCSFIYSQACIGQGAILRKEFCQELMKYKHVDCPGAILHNMDAPELAKRGDSANWNTSKIQFLSNYKFNIAFENSSNDGYITEKLMDAYLANTVPIYYGSEGNVAPFPKASMICVNDYPDFESLMNKIIEVDQNDDVYMSMLKANPLRNGIVLNPSEMLKSFIVPIFKGEGKQYEKDPLMVSDAHRLTRLGGKSRLRILVEMMKIIVKAIYAKYIRRDLQLRTQLGIDYWQMKYALDDAKILASKK